MVDYISKEVADEFGSAWYQGGIRDPVTVLVRRGSVLSRIAPIGRGFGPWLMSASRHGRCWGLLRNTGPLIDNWCRAMKTVRPKPVAVCESVRGADHHGLRTLVE
ncbi:hypothetical protein MTR62_10250 [Novosphingobium sp. 1949]|uniref:Uncharacterized protein n=1 Tax=Novosphingobium organovorum TaxID=2930092 RepID=A0ABT0BDK3_9SPHN|nr:hypothetical protein [Novosphingobium organovorum]MCJ2183069.1 hypothetical protein [Novosphingobium organovorum]